MTLKPGRDVLLLGLTFLLPLLGACSDDVESDNGETLTVFAAASLTAAFAELGAAFEAAHPDVVVEFNFAGSQALATQLVEGASADVFASANEVQMDRVAGEDLVEGDPAVFARNRLAIIVPADNPANVQSMLDLARPDLKFVLAAEDVPAGRYARESLTMLERSVEFQEAHPDFTGFNIVSNETNVSQVLTRVRLGEADAGIVYETDVTPDITSEVDMIPIPDEFNIIASYPIAGLSDGDQELAGDFVEFVLSADGQQILAGWGFLPAAPG